ncbi:hypothetical protein M9H77_04351 [Catharanthus roseus]|uniref:Uncharacterized protein n=1 Tax=Catharanthus roseus TaxID=4058 RepID=A0ACC0CDR6_CATRO|nr:hypothetical protein M9H77_04351 [Catharanthus roseus]
MARLMDWVLSAVSASPVTRYRDELWRYIGNLGNCISFQWLLTGDFNQWGDHSDFLQRGWNMTSSRFPRQCMEGRSSLPEQIKQFTSKVLGTDQGTSNSSCL